jgi:predicted enzyme related to lactoylglutathione lyase
MLEMHGVTVDCADAWGLVQWWSQVTGWTEDPDDPNHPDDPVQQIVSGQGVGLLFIPVPEPKTVKNRLHLDLRPTERTRDEEITRVLGLGATLVADLREPDGSGWAVLADPEGNEFCIVRSQAEYGES